MEGVRISHPDRVLHAESGLTKIDLARYYAAVAEWLVPGLAGRLLTLVRCPDTFAKCFFQKHAGPGLSDVVRRAQVPGAEKPDAYLHVDSIEGVVALVQAGVVELHVWGSRIDKLESPDRMVFDLDPDPSVGWPRIVEAARLVRERLEVVGLRSFVKTTGGKGLHVVVPLARRSRWDEVKEASRILAEDVVRQDPASFVATASKAKRRGRIYVDWLRNARGATWVAPYSARAREGAPVSTPVAWEELGAKDLRRAFTVRTVPARLAGLREDPWKDMASTRQSLFGGLRRGASPR